MQTLDGGGRRQGLQVRDQGTVSISRYCIFGAAIWVLALQLVIAGWVVDSGGLGRLGLILAVAAAAYTVAAGNRYQHIKTRDEIMFRREAEHRMHSVN